MLRTNSKSAWHPVGVVMGCLLGAGATVACNNLLEVSLPGVVKETILDDPKLAGLLVNSAIADFECAYDNFVFGSSAMTDEVWHISGAQVDREWGGRLINADHDNYVFAKCEDGGFGQYTVIHTARYSAEDALRRISKFSDADVPAKTSLMATLSAYAGYDYIMLGEPFCEQAIDGGPIQTPAQVLAVAEQYFTEAIDLAQASGNTGILNMARVGRARVRLDLGNKAGASADASLVPVGFVKNATYGIEPRRRNKGYYSYIQFHTFSVAPPYRGMTWKGVPDPRVTVVDAGVEPISLRHHWQHRKYTSVSDPIPIASWDEAQLIVAEAQLGQTAVDIINLLHTRAGLPAYDPATDGPILQQVLEERKRELFLEGGHRFNDMLRFGLLNDSTPYKSGIDDLGRAYGHTTCWPLPNVERQGNPNIGG